MGRVLPPDPEGDEMLADAWDRVNGWREAGRETPVTYEYCKSHLAPHVTGWCTVPEDHRVPLLATTDTEARDEVRAKGWPIYREGRRQTWSMDGSTILDHGGEW